MSLNEQMFCCCFRVEGLNSTLSSLSEVTQKEIHNHIIQTLEGKESTRKGNSQLYQPDLGSYIF